MADWLPLFALLYAYDVLRSVADTWLTPHVYPQIEFDRFLFGGHIPTVELQRALYTPGSAHVWDYFAFLTYLTHFVVPIGVAAVLWKVAHEKFRRYVFLFVSLTFVTFLTYLFYPAVPPWMASRSGAIAPTARIIDRTCRSTSGCSRAARTCSRRRAISRTLSPRCRHCTPPIPC